ncbi:hypothetical protein BU23DRAFT_464401, partial [Bimuria novae-zelandiae CBS 107.79]
SKPPKALKTSPEAPSNPKDASRAADLAAAEAATDADNANAPTPKPTLPSERTESPASSETKVADNVQPSTTTGATSDAATNLETVKAKPFKGAKKAKKPKSADDVQPPSGSTPKAPSNLKTVKPKTFKAPSKPGMAQPSPAQKFTIELPPPKYHVARSSTRNLPIYSDYKRGGNLHLTTVRKITGDLSALRDELRVFLNKKNEDVKINSLTQQVIVKGHHVPQITQFLQARGM